MAMDFGEQKNQNVKSWLKKLSSLTILSNSQALELSAISIITLNYSVYILISREQIHFFLLHIQSEKKVLNKCWRSSLSLTFSAHPQLKSSFLVMYSFHVHYLKEIMEIKIMCIQYFFVVKSYCVFSQRFTPTGHDLYAKEGILSVSQSPINSCPVIIINNWSHGHFRTQNNNMQTW